MLREAGIEDQPAEDRPPKTLIRTQAAIPRTRPAASSPPLWTGPWRRPAVWDLVTTVTAPGIAGDKVEFATLPAGDMIVDTETGDADLSPLADAVEKQLKPPYRVLARREDDDLWSVAARTIDVVELSFDGGDEIELVENEGVTELRVDGNPWTEEIPELARAGETLGSDFVVQADRLDGDLWEIRASAL